MSDLRVLFVDAPEGYRAQLTDDRGRRLGVEIPFTPFLAEDDYEDLRWYLEDYLDLPDGGAVVRAQRIERTLERWGRQLYDAFFSAAENRALLSQLLAGPEPRRLTIVTKDPELLRLPWELIADNAGGLAQRLSVRRHLEELQESEPRPARLPLRILYIVSRPSDAGFLDPRFTAKALLDALEPLGADVQVEFCRPPTLEQMEEMLGSRKEAGDPFDIVHFDGHGDFSKEKKIGVLYFEEPADALGRAATDRVSAKALGALLSRHAIPLVVLEACRTATVGPTTVFGSVAPHLLAAGVRSVLAMSHAVHVEATRLLMNSFYGELVRGATLGEAVSAARKVLWDDRSRWLKAGPDGRRIELQDWFLPHLYHRAADAALVPSGGHPGAESAARPGFRRPATGEDAGAFPPPPQFGFRGRAWELHELERYFQAKRGLVLHAMGGMGKTALATEAAHWWARSGLFRDGACFLSFEQFMSADRVVQVLGTYLAGSTFAQLSADEQSRRAIELFRQKAVLLVWDNFESVLPQFNDGAVDHASPYTADERHRLVELFRELTKRPGSGRLLVTSRPGDTGLPDAQRYELEGLARADSLWLLASLLDREGLTLADPRLSRESLEPLLGDLADHPLSLELVGPHLRTMTPEEIRADFGLLLTKFQQEAPEERNRSLLASLEFSRRHLSPAAREALPWLGLFRGGVFEDYLFDVSQLVPETWDPIRRELVRTALLRTEHGFGISDRRPFLRFHPTLTFAVSDPTLAQDLEIRHRFLRVYFVLRPALYKSLQGSQPRAALEVLSREEANYRTAVQWALADRQLPAAALLGETFRLYLERLGRLRECGTWVQWLKDGLNLHGFTKEAASFEAQHAWTRFVQGDPQGAVVDQLQALIDRLRSTADFDPAFQLAVTITTLGRVQVYAGAFSQAIPILQEAVGSWEAVIEKEGGRPWADLLGSSDDVEIATELGNLAATKGDLANALRSAGRYDEALAVAERCLWLQTKLGNRREIAAGQELCANILRDAGRYDEADSYYDLALAAARQAGAKDVESTVLQCQGHLALKRNRLERASRLYQYALELFQGTDHLSEIMRTYNFLGMVDRKAGRLAEARAWYEKSRELAGLLKNLPGLGQTAQNIGIVWHLEGEAARARGDEPTARQYFVEARRSMEECLGIWQLQEAKPHEAKSRRELAQIHFHLGEFAAAERHAHEAREIHESLGLKEVFMDYDLLSEIARARSHRSAATEWAKKRDDLVMTEFERSAGGGAMLPQVLQAFQALTLTCAAAGSGDGDPGPEVEEALVQLEQFPAPFPEFATFLRKISAGDVPSLPSGLPVELRDWLQELVLAPTPRAKPEKPPAKEPNL